MTSEEEERRIRLRREEDRVCREHLAAMIQYENAQKNIEILTISMRDIAIRLSTLEIVEEKLKNQYVFLEEKIMDIRNQIISVEKDVQQNRKEAIDKYVTVARYKPIETLILGAIATICTSVLGGLVVLAWRLSK